MADHLRLAGWSESRLTAKVLKHGAISYCIQFDPRTPSRFDPNTLSPQIESALRVWLAALSPPLDRRVRIEGQPCRPPYRTPDLVVALGPTLPGDDSNGAFADIIPGTPSYDGSVLVKIDTDYLWKERRGYPDLPDGDYEWIDFASFVRADRGETLPSLLRQISFSRPVTLTEFRKARGLEQNRVFFSTYRVLVHELGHGFGLCDTFEPLYEKNCDPAHRTPRPQPESVMLNSKSFYPLPDDVAGIRALFARFRRQFLPMSAHGSAR
jgi:hypothetical protein